MADAHAPTVPRCENEAMVRITLNHILIGTLNAVQQRRRVNAKHMFLGTETPLAYAPHKYNAKKRTFYGYADCTVVWKQEGDGDQPSRVGGHTGGGGLSWVSSTLPTYNVQNVS
jgi:hypothetical protein